MQWHLPDIPLLFHHLPHAVADLQKREDPRLVAAGIGQLKPVAPKLAVKHRLILPHDDASPATIAIEKDINPSFARSEQNLGLLLHDYLHTLPEYTPSGKDAEALLEHWRVLLTEQPQRLAEAHLELWNTDHAKHFWQDRLKLHPLEHEAAPHVPMPFDWERTAGAPAPDISQLGQLKVQQWRDLIIRNRMAALTEYLYMRDR